jgi:hypothetical protein
MLMKRGTDSYEKGVSQSAYLYYNGEIIPSIQFISSQIDHYYLCINAQ